MQTTDHITSSQVKSSHQLNSNVVNSTHNVSCRTCHLILQTLLQHTLRTHHTDQASHRRSTASSIVIRCTAHATCSIAAAPPYSRSKHTLKHTPSPAPNAHIVHAAATSAQQQLLGRLPLIEQWAERTHKTTPATHTQRVQLAALGCSALTHQPAVACTAISCAQPPLYPAQHQEYMPQQSTCVPVHLCPQPCSHPAALAGTHAEHLLRAAQHKVGSSTAVAEASCLWHASKTAPDTYGVVQAQ